MMALCMVMRGEVFASTAGGKFSPHIATVQTGEDASAKISHFLKRGICVLSANGAVSNVTLRQSSSARGTMTYEKMKEKLKNFISGEKDVSSHANGYRYLDQ